jgi:copper(I)-binding protein
MPATIIITKGVRMKTALTTLLALAVAGAAQAAPQVQAAWSRPAAQGTTAGGYMTLANAGPKADALVAVESPLAKAVQIHQSMMHGAMATMQALSAVPVPARSRVTFAPGGYHLMFLSVTRPLNVGDTLPATLTFASGAKVKASFVVGLAPPAKR